MTEIAAEDKMLDDTVCLFSIIWLDAQQPVRVKLCYLCDCVIDSFFVIVVRYNLFAGFLRFQVIFPLNI